ncbi:MAG: hypothetical protein RI885_1462 [Actinomycetota bacterium]
MLHSLRSHRTAISALLAIPLLAVALSGCTATSADSTVSPSTESSPSTVASDADYQAAYRDWDLKLAQCLRDAGLEAEDPAPGEFFEQDLPEYQEAIPGCLDEIGDPPIREVTEAEKAEGIKDGIRLIDCLQGKGYDLPDPTLENPAFVPAEVTPEDFEACRTD